VKDDTILIVDDTAANLRLLEAVLGPLGPVIVTASNGAEALEVVAREKPDLVLLDIQMPVMDGFETCRRLRADAATEALPVLMITAGQAGQKVEGLECGADDFVSKPFDAAELRARVRSLLRIKRYHDRIQAQSDELAEWARTLDARVQDQVGEMERLGRLRRFLPSHIADRVMSADGDGTLLRGHRRELAVLFCDIRGFTAFTANAEPEEVIGVLDEYYAVIGDLVTRFEATTGGLAGDGIMVYFNDPIRVEAPAVRAAEMALEMRDAAAGLIDRWTRHGYRLGYGIGIALGYATLGTIGFEGRLDYTPLGRVVNLASRLCDEAAHGEALLDQRAMATIDGRFECEPLEPRPLKGFPEPVPVYRLAGNARC
jgi:adenylate cyclase